jgi:hypothetical protein
MWERKESHRSEEEAFPSTPLDVGADSSTHRSSLARGTYPIHSNVDQVGLPQMALRFSHLPRGLCKLALRQRSPLFNAHHAHIWSRDVFFSKAPLASGAGPSGSSPSLAESVSCLSRNSKRLTDKVPEKSGSPAPEWDDILYTPMDEKNITDTIPERDIEGREGGHGEMC